MVRHRKFDPPFVRKPFSVRVVVPTYKEDIETLEETVECAIKAAQEAMKKGQANAGTLAVMQLSDFKLTGVWVPVSRHPQVQLSVYGVRVCWC